MKLNLAHEKPTLHCTPGRLTCDDGWCCFTMEIGQPLRHGVYEVVTGYSAALKRSLLAFRNDEGAIVGFIHPGDQEPHAVHHVLLGMDRAVDLIVDSKRAYQELEHRVSEADTLFGEAVRIQVQPIDAVPMMEKA